MLHYYKRNKPLLNQKVFPAKIQKIHFFFSFVDTKKTAFFVFLPEKLFGLKEACCVWECAVLCAHSRSCALVKMFDVISNSLIMILINGLMGISYPVFACAISVINITFQYKCDEENQKRPNVFIPKSVHIGIKDAQYAETYEKTIFRFLFLWDMVDFVLKIVFDNPHFNA